MTCRKISPTTRKKHAIDGMVQRLVREGRLPHPTGPLELHVEDLVSAVDSDLADTQVHLLRGHLIRVARPGGDLAHQEERSAEELYTSLALETIQRLPSREPGGDATFSFVVLRYTTPEAPGRRAQFVPAPVQLDFPERAYGEGLVLEPRGRPDPSLPYGVVVSREALQAALDTAWQHPTVEVSLMPVGQCFFDPVLRRPWLFIDEMVFAAIGNAVTVEIPPDRVAGVRARLVAEGRGRGLLGTYHSHVIGNLAERVLPEGQEPAHGNEGPLHVRFAADGGAQHAFFSDVDRAWFEGHRQASIPWVADVLSGAIELATFGFGYDGELARWSGFDVAVGSSTAEGGPA